MVHNKSVDKDNDDKAEDTPLLGEPESEWIAGIEKGKLIEAIGEKNATTKTDQCPEQKQNRHDDNIAAPVTVQNLAFVRR